MIRRTGCVLIAFAMTACAGDPPPPQATLADTAVAEERVPEPPPLQAAPAASRIGQLPLLRLPPDQGSCRFTGSQAEPRWAYEANDFPKRSIYVGEGSEGRAFRASFLEIRASQLASGGVDDNETLYVLFGADGRIETGTRQYFSTASPPVRETGGLLPGDTTALRDIALFVLQKCKQPTPAP